MFARGYLPHTGSDVPFAIGATVWSSCPRFLAEHVYLVYAPAYSAKFVPTTNHLTRLWSTSLHFSVLVLQIASLITPVAHRLHTPRPFRLYSVRSTAKPIGFANGGDRGITAASPIPTSPASCSTLGRLTLSAAYLAVSLHLFSVGLTSFSYR